MKEINWSEIPFGYMKTDYNVRCYYRDGAWGELEVSSSENIDIHMASTCLRKRSAWSSGSFSSEKPLANSRPVMNSSKRSVISGSWSDERASGETSAG